jgi:chromosome segregation ATPase
MRIPTPILLLPLCALLTSCFKDLSVEIEEVRRQVRTADQETMDLNSRAQSIRDKAREINKTPLPVESAAEAGRRAVLREEIKQLKATIAANESRLDGYKAEAVTYSKQNP